MSSTYRGASFRRCRLVLLACALATVAIAQEPPAPVVHVDGATITVSNVTPGGSVLLVMQERGSSGGILTVRQATNTLTDDDGNGVVALTRSEPLAFRSVCVAVDETSGAFAVGAPDGFEPYVAPLPANALKKDAAGAMTTLVSSVPRARLLVVRPGQGAWTLDAREGGKNDHDETADGNLAFNFQDAAKVDSEQTPPSHVQAGDVVAIITPVRLDVFISRVTE